MTDFDLHTRTTALVLIDLQNGITALPTIEPADVIVTRAAALAAAFRAAGLPVVLVHTDFSGDGADLLAPPVDAAPPAVTLSADFADFRRELDQSAGDIVITKRQWDAFHGTELDLQLRRRGVSQIALAGISTSIGVESTARQAFSHGYSLLFVSDATTDMLASAHANSMETIFPRLGRRVGTEELLAALALR